MVISIVSKSKKGCKTGFYLQWHVKSPRPMVWVLAFVIISLHPFSTNANDSGLVVYEPESDVFILPITSANLLGGYYTLYSPIANTLNILLSEPDNVLYQVNLSTREIQKHDMTQLPREVNRMAEDPLTGDIILWDTGVGRVYRLLPDGSLNRIDNSYNHRNQFNHTPWVDNRGNIYAFGGYGLFTAKSIITRYDQLAREWFLVHVDDERHMPAPQSSALVVPDNTRNIAYFIGIDRYQHEVGRYHMKPHYTDAMWMFNTKESNWRKIGSIPYTRIQNINKRSFNTIDSTGRFMLLPLISQQNFIEIIAYFPHTHQHVSLREYGVRISNSNGLTDIFWSPTRQAYYFTTATWVSNSDQVKVVLNRITITNPDAFVEWYGNGISYSEVSPIRYLFLLFPVAMFILVQWLRKRKSNNPVSNHDSDTEGYDQKDGPHPLPQNSSMNIGGPSNGNPDRTFTVYSHDIRTPFAERMIDIEDEFLLEINGPDAYGNYELLSRIGQNIVVDGNYEKQLLQLLVKNFKEKPSQYTTTVEIDEVLIPDHPSQDYIRRIRNLTVSRLTIMLNEAAGLVSAIENSPIDSSESGIPEKDTIEDDLMLDNSEIIYDSDDKSIAATLLFRRKNRSDKRKFEYRLNGKYILIR